ncbi:hypothetical protein V1477_019411 [Vespula maculifrons]|uniref:Uncharacterized protein n=1 Tax=Vespula maculifrons TaxID=7453 RepID=A0ABD2AV43_VESMC
MQNHLPKYSLAIPLSQVSSIAASNNDDSSRCFIDAHNIHLNQDPSTPSVVISSKNLEEKTTFLVDTGSELNIFKLIRLIIICFVMKRIRLN